MYVSFLWAKNKPARCSTLPKRETWIMEPTYSTFPLHFVGLNLTMSFLQTALIICEECTCMRISSVSFFLLGHHLHPNSYISVVFSPDTLAFFFPLMHSVSLIVLSGFSMLNIIFWPLMTGDTRVLILMQKIACRPLKGAKPLFWWFEKQPDVIKGYCRAW